MIIMSLFSRVAPVSLVAHVSLGSGLGLGLRDRFRVGFCNLEKCKPLDDVTHLRYMGDILFLECPF